MAAVYAEIMVARRRKSLEGGWGDSPQCGEMSRSDRGDGAVSQPFYRKESPNGKGFTENFLPCSTEISAVHRRHVCKGKYTVKKG